MKKEFIKLSGILCIITLVAALLLACVNNITAPRIELASQMASENAMKSILSEAETFEKADEYITKGFSGKNLAGYCVSLTTAGFGGDIEVMVGIGADGTVKGIEILNHSETAGLGAKATGEEFKNQFRGKIPYLTVVKKETESADEIKAITGATITSKAISDAVATAYEMVVELERGNN